MSVVEADYFTVAVVTLPDNSKRPVRVWKKPSQTQLNLLYILCEHVGHLTTIDDICHRMEITVNALRILTSRLRKRLSSDWIISTTNNKGLRIIYNGPEFTTADQTKLEIDFARMRQKNHSPPAIAAWRQAHHSVEAD